MNSFTVQMASALGALALQRVLPSTVYWEGPFSRH